MAKRFERLCVIGLGYVGLPAAAAFATNDIEVIGVDVDAERVASINNGVAPMAEPFLDIMLRSAVASGKLRAQRETAPADAFIVAVPTPLTDGRAPDLSHLKAAAKSLAPALEAGNLVVLESTSPVGTTEALCQWLADLRPDLSFPDSNGEGSDIRVAYSPERVLPGHIVVELLQNDRVVGGVTPACAAAAKALYEIFLQGTCSITNARTAELAKLTENAYRDVNIAFANEISSVCAFHGVDPWDLIELANRHPRVDVLRPGPGVGGHCIAVDPWFLVHAAPDLTPLIGTARRVNDEKPRKVVQRVLSVAAGMVQPDIACLGLSYKADVGDLRESPSIAVVRGLQQAIAGRLLVVEPHIDALPAELARSNGTVLTSLDEALASAEIVVLLTEHHAFRRVDRRKLANKAIVDTRGIWRSRPGAFSESEGRARPRGPHARAAE